MSCLNEIQWECCRGYFKFNTKHRRNREWPPSFHLHNIIVCYTDSLYTSSVKCLNEIK